MVLTTTQAVSQCLQSQIDAFQEALRQKDKRYLVSLSTSSVASKRYLKYFSDEEYWAYNTSSHMLTVFK